MFSFIRSLGWQTLSHQEYAQTWQRFGGSVITHPDILDFIQQRFDCSPLYLGKPDGQGGFAAAIATWGKSLAGDKEALVRLGIEDRYDFGSPEVMLPLGPEFHGMLGYRSKFVSQVHQAQISNSSSNNRTRTICLAKGLGPDGMSGRSCQRRRNQVRHMLEAGASIQPVTAYSPQQLAQIFAELFQKRWNRPHPQGAYLVDMLTALQPHITGHVILFNEQAAAFQLLLATTSARYYSLEYINGGVDPAYKEFSIGSVLTWLNVEQSWQHAQSENLEFHYSFGRNSAEYKAQWANESQLLRVRAW